MEAAASGGEPASLRRSAHGGPPAVGHSQRVLQSSTGCAGLLYKVSRLAVKRRCRTRTTRGGFIARRYNRRRLKRPTPRRKPNKFQSTVRCCAGRGRCGHVLDGGGEHRQRRRRKSEV